MKIIQLGIIRREVDISNVSVHGWIGDKNICVDLTEVFLLVELGTRDKVTFFLC
jgi:hypothetical protein